MRTTKTIQAIGLAATAALTWAGASMAADLTPTQPIYVPPAPPPAIVPEEPFDWTGFHIGLDVGGQFDFADSYVNSENEHSFYGTWQELSDEANLGAASWFISGDVGYDHQVSPNFVVGVFANFDLHPSKGTASHSAWADAPCIDCTDVNYDLPEINDENAQQTRYKEVGNEVTYGNAWGVGLRAGVLVRPTTLVYGLGGYGQKQINADSSYYFNYYNGLEYNGGLSAGGWQPGWFVGAGVETALGQRTTLGLEYRFAKYKGFGASCEIPGCSQSEVGPYGPYTAQTGPYEFNWSEMSVGSTASHTIRARLSLWLN